MNAHDDEKIQNLITKYRFEGYGWYWYLLEIMGTAEKYRLEITDLFYCSLARRFLTNQPKAKRFIDDCVAIGLLARVTDEGDEGEVAMRPGCRLYVTSLSFRERMQLRDLRSQECAKSGSKGGKASSERFRVAQGSLKGRCSNEMKGNEMKGNEIDDNEGIPARLKKPSKPKKEIVKIGDFVKMSRDDLNKLLEKYGKETIDTICESINLYCGKHGRRYNDYYYTALDWMRRNEQKGLRPDGKPKNSQNNSQYSGRAKLSAEEAMEAIDDWDNVTFVKEEKKHE